MTDKIRQYNSPTAFRVALETRLRMLSNNIDMDLQQIRRQVSFDRLLARLFAKKESAEWILKRGYAMEMRLQEARTTKDIDFCIPIGQQQDQIIKELQSAVEIDLHDFFIFKVGKSMMDLDGPPEGGVRYPIHALIDDRIFIKFHIDVGIGDVVILPTELIEGRDWLGFAGIPPVKVIAISREQQFAEKLHAYTQPRENNSRVKDIVDMGLIIRMGALDKNKLREAIERTFWARNMAIPKNLSNPPSFWQERYQTLASETKLNWTIKECICEIRAVFDSLIFDNEE